MTTENEPTETSLKGHQRTYLRGLGQGLKPKLVIGKEGASDAVIKELNGVLEREELVKLRLPAVDKEARTALVDTLCTKSGAHLCGILGHTATLYRRQPDPLKRKIRLPK